MELRQYWHILWQRIWIPVVLVLVVGGVSLATQKTPPPTYNISFRFVVGVTPESTPDQFDYDGYYAGLASEYVADDLSVIVGSQAFTDDVNRHLEESGSELCIPAGALAGMTFAGKQHRILSVSINWAHPDELNAIGTAVIAAIENDSPKYLTQLGSDGGRITIIDRPLAPAPVPPSLTSRLDLPIRIVLALLAGIALVFLLYYLNTGIQSKTELEAMGISVLAQIPRHK